MAVRIRLRRMGAKKRPFYRIVVADSRSPADIKVDVEKARKWLSTGAQPSDTVRDLLKKQGVI